MITRILQESLEKSYSYKKYMELMEKLATEGKTTWHEPSPDMVALTALNFQRMKRLNKTLKISEEQQSFFASYQGKQIWVVITESWCADAAQTVPMLMKIAEICPNVELRLVLRDENHPLMNAFLTGGAMSIPIMVLVDAQSFKVLSQWGPRPEPATQMVVDYKKEHGKLTPQFKEDLQKWYNHDKGQSVAQEIQSILTKI